MTDKFKFKVYEKIDGNDAIEYRLNKEKPIYEEANEVNEAQLEDYREGTEDTTIEGLLNQKRKASTDFEVVERQLETGKGMFGTKYRNSDTYEGDINKLEEKRLLNKPVEEEKYETASETTPKLRWWEVDKKKNDLDIA